MKKHIKILSPSPVKFDTINGFIAHYQTNPIFFDNILGVNLPVIYHFIDQGIISENGEPIPVNLDIENLLNIQLATIIHEVKSINGQCSNISEHIFNKLKNINSNFRAKPLLSNIFESYLNKNGNNTDLEKEKIFKKLDFMKHRDIFSDIIKSKKIDWLNSVLEEYDIPSLKNSFFKFISDRNIYTHGIVNFCPSQKKILLEYEDVDKNITHGEINKDIQNSYVKCFNDLDELLSTILNHMNL